MEANFQQKVTIIRGAYCLQLREFPNDNSFETKSDFKFSRKKSLCSINDLEHLSEISLFISSAQTFPAFCGRQFAKFKVAAIDCFHDPIMQHVLGGSLHKNNTCCLLLGLYHASVN